MPSEQNHVLSAVEDYFNQKNEAVEKHFDLPNQKSSVGKEILSGFLNFLAALPVFAFIPGLLATAGITQSDVFMAIVASSALGTFFVSFVAGKPLVVVPSVTMAIFVTETVMIKMGLSLHFALFCCFAESFLFFALSVSDLRDKFFSLIPRNLKYGISAGIGLWLIVISLKISGLITVGENFVVSVPSFRSPVVIIALLGILSVGIFSYWKLKGACLYAFLLSWGLAIVAQLTGWYQVDETHASMIPTTFFQVPEWLGSAGACFDFSAIYNQFTSVFSLALTVLMVVVTMFFMDTVESVATLDALYPEEETEGGSNVFKSKQLFVSAAVSSMVAAALGAPNNMVGKSSAVGIQVGGKTGLSAFVSGIFMLALLFLTPFFQSIPAVTMVPVLFYVGVLFIRNLSKVSFDNLSEFIPAVISFVFVGFASSPIYGLTIGVLSFTVINVACGKIKKISVAMWILTALSLAFLIFA